MPKKKVTKIELKVPESEVPILADIVEATIDKPDLVEEEDLSLISAELHKFELEIAEIQDALSSIKLKDIEGAEEKLKAINGKITAQLKLPNLLSALEDLRNKNQIKIDAIKGNKSFSPLEDGFLDD